MRGTPDACFICRTPCQCAAAAHARRHGDARPAITIRSTIIFALCAASQPSSGGRPIRRPAEDIRRFQVHQRESGVQPPTINCSVSALRFFFTVTLDRPDLSRRLVLARYPRKLPAVLSVEEVGRLLEAAPGPNTRPLSAPPMARACACQKWPALKVDDIDSTRMLIRVEQGKGRKDRNAMLSPQLLELLRLWWKEGKRRGVMLPHGWLFPGRTLAIRSRPGRSTARSMRQPKRLGSGSGCRPIRCATASPPICWNRMSISA